MKKSRFKRWVKRAMFATIAVFVLIAVCDLVVRKASSDLVFEDIGNLTQKNAALVLGTSFEGANGYVNPYFKYRMEAAAELYHAGKVKYIIVSGDNGRKEYDEPTDMKEYLVKLGVPAEVIYLDYAGFRTLDSVVRCKEIFNQEDVIVVSQKFHNQRAIYLAKGHGIEAVGYNARDLNTKAGLHVRLREKLARVKAVSDLIFNKQPRFLGPTIELSRAEI